MRFACFTRWEELPPSAGRLFERAARTSLFLSYRWFENLSVNALEDHQALLLACVLEGDNVLAVLPLRNLDNGNWGSLSSYYTPLFSVLIADRDQGAILDCMAAGLSQLTLQSLRLDPLAEHDPAMRQLQQAMERHGFASQGLFHFVNWSHRLQGQTYAQYLEHRPTRLRNTIARKRRKLQREHGFEIRLYTDRDLDQAMVDYNAVYKASWKAGERFTGFVPALVKTMADRGWLRLALLYVDGRPAAGQIWFVAHDKASIFRLAYDEAWQQYSPGSILTAFLMQHVIDVDKVESIDFLHGNERYKQDWMSERRERWRLVFVNHGRRATGSRSLTRLRDWLRGRPARTGAPSAEQG